AHELCMTVLLQIVQSAQHASNRPGIVILHEYCIDAAGLKTSGVIGFHEEPPLVRVDPRLDDQHAWKRGFNDVQGARMIQFSLTTDGRLPIAVRLEVAAA